MKHFQPSLPGRDVRRQARRGAFTITELMVALSIFSVIVIGITSVQVFGIKLYQISQAKLSSTASGRKALNQVRSDILEGRMLVVQDVTGGNLATHHNIAANTPQAGNALQISPYIGNTNFVLYYTDPTEKSLMRYTSSNQVLEVVANYITNSAFRAEDFQGNVLITNQNNRVIRLVLDFYQDREAGRNTVYDSYRLQTRVTARMIK